jgi:hypothetical protein
MSDRMADLQLSHFSEKTLGEIRSVEQRLQGDYKSEFEKPKGLWVSVDGEDDWESWCRSEMTGWIEHKQRYRVILAETPRILVLSSHCDLDDFQHEYGRDCGRWNEKYIEWPSVAAKYSGIIIAPYQWSCRMDMNWYYGWDCASGCIWNADAIDSVEEIREAQAA